MGVEIERKFLLGNDSWRSAVTGSQTIRQGYLAQGEGASVRIRLVDARTALLTVKSVELKRTRSEWEYAVPLADGEELIALCGQQVIEKHRHIVVHRGNAFEVDVFAGALAGLVVVELELEDETAKFERPSWLGEEVTDDPRYRNSALARDGRPR